MSQTLPEVMAMLDDLLGPRDPEIVRHERESEHRKALGIFIKDEDLAGIKTKGCLKCKGTMYLTVDRDSKKKQWICQNIKCGAIEVVL